MILNISDQIKNIEDVEKVSLIFYSVSKREVYNKDFSRIRKSLEILKETGKKAKGKMALSFSGYDDDIREVYMIPEIREFVRILWNEYKYIFYFLTFLENNRSIIFACINEFEAYQYLEHKVTKMRIKKNENITKQTMDAMIEYGLQIDDVEGAANIIYSFM